MVSVACGRIQLQSRSLMRPLILGGTMKFKKPVLRTIIAGALVASAVVTSAPASAVSLPGCYYYGKFLAGKVQIVTTSLGRATDKVPTFKVQAVTAFQDLKVQTVTAFPTTCGKWKYVTSFPDFKVRFVTAFPDFKIKFVTAFPGTK